MTVAHIVFNQQIHAINTNPTIDKDDEFDHKDENFRQLYRVATLCNNARFKGDQDDVPLLKRETIGDASESAILKYTERNMKLVVPEATKTDVCTYMCTCVRCCGTCLYLFFTHVALVCIDDAMQGYYVFNERARYKTVVEIPFNSSNKYQVSVHEDPADSRYLLVMKGAPERIIARSGYLYKDGTVQAMTGAPARAT